MRHITEDLRKDLTSIIQDEFWQQGCDGDSFESVIRQQVDKLANTLEMRMNEAKTLHSFGVTRHIFNYRGKWYLADSVYGDTPFIYQLDSMPEESADLAWIKAHTVDTIWYEDAHKLIKKAYKN